MLMLHNVFNRLTPMQHGVISIVFGLILLGYLLHIFETFFFFILLIIALLSIAQGIMQSGLYAKIMELMRKHENPKV